MMMVIILLSLFKFYPNTSALLTGETVNKINSKSRQMLVLGVGKTGALRAE